MVHFIEPLPAIYAASRIMHYIEAHGGPVDPLHSAPHSRPHSALTGRSLREKQKTRVGV